MATLRTYELSRQSLQMTLTTISAFLLSKPGPMTFIIKLVDQKLSEFLKECPESFFKITIEGKSDAVETNPRISLEK